MGGRGDWGVAASSLTLPPFAAPDDAAIVIGPDLPTCMQANYTSAIFWRPPLSLAPTSAPYYFMAQRKTIVGAPGTQQVDHGFLINDGVTCGYTVYKRVASTNFGASVLAVQEETGSAIENAGGVTVVAMQPQWTDGADMKILGTATLQHHGDYFSLRNDSEAGAANANASTNSAAFANYPTNVTNVITKLGPAGETHLLCTYEQTFYVDNTNTGPKFAVNDGTNDHFSHQVAPTLPATFARMASVGTVRLIGLAAGTYTLRPRWARFAGTGSVFAAINDDWTVLTTTEVAV